MWDLSLRTDQDCGFFSETAKKSTPLLIRDLRSDSDQSPRHRRINSSSPRHEGSWGNSSHCAHFGAMWGHKHNLKTVTQFWKTVPNLKLRSFYERPGTNPTATQILRWQNQIASNFAHSWAWDAIRSDRRYFKPFPHFYRFPPASMWNLSFYVNPFGTCILWR